MEVFSFKKIRNFVPGSDNSVKDEQDVWKLIECGSRFVTETEAHIAMVELELLAAVWALRKCHSYLFGLPEFTLIPDHQPLRLKSYLTPYDFKTVWKRGKDNRRDDALSRLPVDKPTEGDDDFTQDMNGSIHTIIANLLDTINNSDISQIEYNILGKKDKHNINPNHHPTIETGSNLSNDYTPVIKGQKNTLKQARLTIFWPGITADIRNIIDAFEECQTCRSSLPKEPLKSDPAPRDVFQEIATDFFEVRGKHYLAIVDRYSQLSSRSQIFRQHQHLSLLSAASSTTSPPSEGLLELRNTPLRHGSLSPSQIVFGRPMRSRLPVHNLSLAEDWQERLNEHDRHIAKQHEYAKNHYNKTSNELKPIPIGSKVWIQDPTSKIWDRTATVQGKKQDKEYIFLLPSGRTLCRNRRFIRILRTREDIITTPQCESTLKDNSQTNEPSNPQRPNRLRFAPIKFTP
ncbi:unnamed protein product [Lepeophtheirus salmonis]|uniref:RNA-directed DNA polymerase n=1 Tax=Lepeophtheirus salmonis TaxID=72036 RepID=A0A7R8D589_LEPSM|nr:unnamed protein product [Lepeophtheirus salmonis]CAF3033640.1 unnamed protein product [Lepeophtheirus salmonis]